MRHVRMIAFAGATALYATASLGADLAPPPPPLPSCIPPGAPPIVGVPPCAEEFSGWYLRGDIGMTNQSVGKITNALDSTALFVNTVQKSFDSSMLFGVGLGYQWNDWLRTDVTGEYRSKANFHGLQIAADGGGTFTDEYTASKSEWLFLANAYVDLGTWWNITPFVGGGVGMSYNKISNFQDINTPRNGVAFGADTGKWSFAWAVHAGLAYRVTDSLTLELAYRYVDLGDAQSGDLVTYLGANQFNNPEKFNHITSQDVKVGLRWALGGGPSLAPLVPASTYAPAPAYVQPESVYSPPQPSEESYPAAPLHSRG